MVHPALAGTIFFEPAWTEPLLSCRSQRYGLEKIRITLAENGIRTDWKRISAITQELPRL